MLRYPIVLSEDETIDEILKGKSIARYGDGEIKLMRGKDCVSQRADKRLAIELSAYARSNNPNCLIAIPNITDAMPKLDFWGKYKTDEKYIRFYNPSRFYYSSFITRPDNAPWINTKEYWQKVERIWKGKKILLVTGGRSSALRSDTMEGAKFVSEIFGPETHAYEEIDNIEARIMETASAYDTVILCLGATATCLAWRLSEKNVHALDLGHIGMFLRRFREGRG